MKIIFQFPKRCVCQSLSLGFKLGFWGPLWGGVATSCCLCLDCNLDSDSDYEYNLYSDSDADCCTAIAFELAAWVHKLQPINRCIAAALLPFPLPNDCGRHDRGTKIPGMDLVDLLLFGPGNNSNNSNDGGTLTTCLQLFGASRIWLWPRHRLRFPLRLRLRLYPSSPDCCRLLQLLRVVAFMSWPHFLTNILCWF